MAEEVDSRRLRIILRRPEAAQQAEELAAIPNGFDKIFTKPYFAHQLRLAGHDWPYIAARLKYGSGYKAEMAVRKWLAKKVDGDDTIGRTRAVIQAEAVRLDLDRLDKLMAAYWDEAISGDLSSANYVLRIIAQRARYIAPDTNVAAGTITNQINTLVVGGSETEYVGALMKARESLGPAHRVTAAPDDRSDVVDLEPVKE